MKRYWTDEELAEQWSLSTAELEILPDRIYSYSADETEEYFALFYERDGLNIPNLLYQQGTRH
ncbi:MAG TPA: hypothetical protein VE735_05045 [Gammaproteobacteria bacterium]|nr:hypothetical protein [Gammaproteobacteria bacterium]